MKENKWLNRIITASDVINHSEWGYVLLRRQLSLLLGFICVFYLLFDLINGIYLFLPWQIAGIGFALLILYLNHTGKYNLASVFLLLILNLLIFAFAASDSPSRGVYFYFITTATFSLILFFPRARVLTTIFIILPVALAILALTESVIIFEAPVASNELRNLYFVINFLIAAFGTLLIIRFSILQNFKSNRMLIENEARVLQNNIELEKTNYELDQFVYSASHDMKAPLSTISGLIMLAKNSSSLEEAGEYIALMDGRIQALNGFISDITDYSRNVRLEPELEQVNIKEVCQEVIDFYQFLADKSDIIVELKVDKDYVNADKMRVSVILGNLLSNAIKYHNPYADKRIVNISVITTKNEMHLIVEDNGLGIPNEHKDRIFGMFYRASEKSDGSGLGLYIVREMINRLGGKIVFTSEATQGTSFKVSLPTIS